jgi:hypothetical protein
MKSLVILCALLYAATALKEDAGMSKNLSINNELQKKHLQLHIIISIAYRILNFAHALQDHLVHLEYSTKGPMSNVHRGSTRVLLPNKVMFQAALMFL